MWCWLGCGSSAAALTHEKQGLGRRGVWREWVGGVRGGYPQMTWDIASLCSLLSPRACLSACSVASIWVLPRVRTLTVGYFEGSV